MRSTDSSAALLTAVIDLLWSQWTDLGVAGTKGSGRMLVDPEALLLATLSFGRHDARLFDEVLDWLTLNGDLLDVTRLRRLTKRAHPDVRRLASVVIDFMRQRGSGSKWNPLAERWQASEVNAVYASQALFLDSTGEALPTFGATDPFFANHGYLRPPLELRGMSSHPRPSQPCLMRLAARNLVGIGVRAETLAYLWTHESAHGRLISTRADYSQRQVAEYLAGLAEAGFAERWEEGRTTKYRLTASAPGAAGSAVSFVDWAQAFAALGTLHSAWEGASRARDSYEASVQARAALTALRSALPFEGINLPVPTPDGYPGESVLSYAEALILQMADMVQDLARPA